MQLPSLEEIRHAQQRLLRFMPPTPQYTWPLLNERLGTEVWIKHENHTPVGAFKIRGALLYLESLKSADPQLAGVVAATRGNHGQGVATAARLMGIKSILVVPRGNSREKNTAMVAQGAELIEHGADFQESIEYATELAAERGFSMVHSFDERLVLGTATFAIELFEAAPPLSRVYVPIGLGSSICGVCAARNALGLTTEVIGVVSAQAPAYARSFASREIVEAPAQTRIADGVACRRPVPAAMEIIWKHVARVMEVTDEHVASAMRAYYRDTHNVAEGAGAVALAGAMNERQAESRIGVVLTGANVDREVYADVLAGRL